MSRITRVSCLASRVSVGCRVSCLVSRVSLMLRWQVARGDILGYFNQIFDGLCKLFADVDVDVKNGSNLLDRLIKVRVIDVSYRLVQA